MLLEMPVVPGYEHILEYLAELGFAERTGFGLQPFSYQEIYSWTQLTRTRLTLSELEAIRRLSSVYVDQTAKSADRNCPPPFVSEDYDVETSRKSVDSFFRNISRKRTQ